MALGARGFSRKTKDKSFFPIQHNKGGTSAHEIITASTVNDSLLTKTQWVHRVQNNNDAFVEESSSRCSEYRLFHLLCL